VACGLSCAHALIDQTTQHLKQPRCALYLINDDQAALSGFQVATRFLQLIQISRIFEVEIIWYTCFFKLQLPGERRFANLARAKQRDAGNWRRRA